MAQIHRAGWKMNKVVNVSLRIVGTLLAATVASYFGFIVSGMAVQHWYVTHATKELHSDGQAGLGIFVGALYGG
ncbi:MAG TPA: hypothetical protein VJT08_14645, partial [Terriglobales bacterium]|nr:hypothetical protein [Terriglobales bacterium]